MEGHKESHNRLRSTCAQVAASLALNCMMINVAMVIGMPTLVIGALKLGDVAVSLTEEQESWFGGLLFIVQPMGSVFSGFLQDRLGRKMCMLISSVPVFFGWLILYFAKSVWMLFSSLIILGLCIGFMQAPTMSYIGEISEPRLRGILGTLSGIFLNIGFLIINLIGSFTDWRSMALYSSAAPVIAFFFLCLVPDSPSWLMTQGREEDARKAIQWLRGWVSLLEVQEELDALATYVRKNQKMRVDGSEYCPVSTDKGELTDTRTQNIPESTLKILLHPSVLRPFLLITVYFFVGASAGLIAIRPFFIELLITMEVPMRPHLVIVIGTILTLLGSLTSTLCLRRIGKRGLTFVSLFLSIICCWGLTFYLILGLKAPWIPLGIFLLNFFVVPLGVLTVPWMLISELFPLRARGPAGGLSGAIGYLFMFAIVKTFHNIVSCVDMSGTCFLYGAIGVLGFIYLYFRLPETEGVPLEVIESFFADDKKHFNGRAQRHMRLDRANAIKICKKRENDGD